MCEVSPDDDHSHWYSFDVTCEKTGLGSHRRDSSFVESKPEALLETRLSKHLRVNGSSFDVAGLAIGHG